MCTQLCFDFIHTSLISAIHLNKLLLSDFIILFCCSFSVASKLLQFMTKFLVNDKNLVW